MCVLCGEFVADVHWSDHGLEAAARAPEANPGDYDRDRRRDRIHRAGLANKVLRLYGLRVSDWNGGRYVLRDPKGRSALVADLGTLWPAAEKLTGRTPDPLDPALLQTLRGE